MQATRSVVSESIPENRQESVRAELSRILQSQSFRGSRRCCRFLEYSVQHVLDGNAQEDLRERSIGVEVFHRAADYDTNEDAIVRVTANEVRKRLAQYYQEAGDGSDPAIALPAGSYAVTFRWKQAAAPAEEPVRAHRPIDRWIGAAIIAALGLTAALYLTRAWPAPARATPADPLWSRVFRPGQKTNIVTADAARFEIGELLNCEVSLKQYLSPEYPVNLAASANPELKRVIRFMGTRQTTSVASAMTGARLLELGTRLGGNPVVRHPRHINAHEFKTDNFILLGSRLSIPWVEMLEPGLNFPIRIDPKTHEFYLENRSPRPGERARYVRPRAEDDTYVDIAVIPNMEHSGTILILNAIDMAGIDGATEFAMHGGLARLLTDAAGMEILLYVRSIGGAAAKVNIVTIRPVNPAAK